MEARGLLYRDSNDARLNLTSLQTVGLGAELELGQVQGFTWSSTDSHFSALPSSTSPPNASMSACVPRCARGPAPRTTEYHTGAPGARPGSAIFPCDRLRLGRFPCRLMKCSTTEPRREVALDDARREVVERPAGGRAAANGLDHGLERQAGLVAIEQRFAHARPSCRRSTIWLHIFVCCPAPGPP